MEATDGANVPPAAAPGGEGGEGAHAVQFYDDEEYLIRMVGRHVLAGHKGGAPALVIATAVHRRALERLLAQEGIDAGEAVREGRLACPDATETLALFMRDGAPDRALFFEAVGGMVGGLATGGRRVWGFGEMVALLWQEGKGEAAARVEELWNELGKKHPIKLLCAYPMSGFSDGRYRALFERLCAAHDRVMPSEEYAAAQGGDKDRMLAFLQQRSRSLEAEVRERNESEQDAKALLAAIVDSSEDGIISKSLQGIITSWNQGATRIFGYTAEEAIGQPVMMLFPRDRQEEEDRILERIRRGERVDHFETVRVRKDGTPIDVSLTISPVRNSLGRLIGASKIARDITEQKRAQERLREREQFLGAIVATTPECLKIVSADGKLLDMNPAGLAMVGARSRQEVMGRSVYDLVAPEDRAAFIEFNERVCRGERGALEFEIIGLKGVRLSMETYAVPLKNPDGTTVLLALSRDVTEQRRARRTLQKQNRRLRLLNEAAGHLLAAEAPDEMARGLFLRMGKHLELDACVVYVMDEAANRLSLLASAGGEADHTAGPEFARELCEHVVAQRHGAALEFIQQSDKPLLAGMRAMGFRAAVCEPLPMGHRLLGALCFASRSRDWFEEDDVQFIRTLCHYVATAYERVGLLKRLRAEDRRKDEFLATLAHELRNPLAPLCSTLELLRMGSVNPALRDQLREMMQQQLRQLTRLVDDLMEISRITSGKISLKREQVDLSVVLQNAINMSRPQVEKLRHMLTASLPPETIVVDADAVRLSQVFVNLLNNAAKYTEEGGKIDVSVRHEGMEAVVSVKDSGVGIPVEMLPQVFDMFAQVDRTLNRAQGGLGIGLALAKQLVELHGGRIEAHSEGPGKGSEFIVRLVCVEVLQESPRGVLEKHGHLAMRQRRILVADDNREAALSLSLLLQSLGHTTRVAFDGVQALEMAEEFRPEGIVMDIGMPRLDGYGAARKLRERAWMERCLLVALSGWGQEEDRRLAKEAGFDYHFTKPIDIDALIALLEAGPRMKEMVEEAAEAANPGH